MADIELVIKVDESDVDLVRKNFKPMGYSFIPLHIQTEFVSAILNGTPLPKGHGQLKDADVMINKLCTHEASELFGSTTCAEILDFINAEKPIIEEDKEQSDEQR